MSVFGFIENFFFISLGIVIGLILLLVYHFKNRMAVAEKKSESMYGLLSAVVKEIKSLRGMFGIGGSKPEDVCLSDMNISNQTYSVAQKTQPEVNITVTESRGVLQPQEVIMVDLTESAVSATQKIVVSDDESDSDEESESSESDEDVDDEEELKDLEEEKDQDLEEDPEEEEDDLDEDEEDDVDEDSVSEPEPETETEPEPEPKVDEDEEDPEDEDEDEDDDLDVKDLEAENVASQPIVVNDFEILDLEDHIDITPVIPSISIREPTPVREPAPVAIREPAPVVIRELAPVAAVITPAPLVVDVASTPNVFTLDALRKMNVNQLKTVALQLGVTTDTSKLKRPELIALINTHK